MQSLTNRSGRGLRLSTGGLFAKVQGGQTNVDFALRVQSDPLEFFNFLSQIIQLDIYGADLFFAQRDFCNKY
jgi:hypothetical protein